jgi:hypothetical protein
MPAASTVAAFSGKTIEKTQFEMQKVAFLRKKRFGASYLDTGGPILPCVINLLRYILI